MAIQGSVCPLIVQPCDVVLSNVAQEQGVYERDEC